MRPDRISWSVGSESYVDHHWEVDRESLGDLLGAPRLHQAAISPVRLVLAVPLGPGRTHGSAFRFAD